MKPELHNGKLGKLNSFQKTMLQWNELHPYNAVHVVRVAEPLDLDRLSRGINALLQQLRLGKLHLDANRGTYRYHDEPVNCEVRSMDAGKTPGNLLQAEIERELNTGFDYTRPFCPFRFFVVSETDSFLLASTYFHPIADAESIVRLVRLVVDAYLKRSIADNPPGLETYPKRHDTISRQSPTIFGKKLLALPCLVRNMRSSCRPPFRDPNDLANRFTFFQLYPASLPALLAAAKSLGVTLNDLFLALLLKSIAPLASRRMKATRRRKLSVGCIVNLRRDLDAETQEAFGLFLGSFIVTHLVPDDTSLKDLAREIGTITQRIKQARLYSGMLLELSIGRLALHLFSTERKKTLYQKHYPLWGGITNMNLNAIWDQQRVEKPVDYFRAVSTGPVTPLVLSITTAGNNVNIGLTYRSAVFSLEQVEQIKENFLRQVKQLEV